MKPKRPPIKIGSFELNLTTSTDGSLPLCRLGFTVNNYHVDQMVKKHCDWLPTSNAEDFKIEFAIFNPKDVEHIMKKFYYNRVARKYARSIFETYIREFEFNKL